MLPWEQRFASLWHTYLLATPGLPNDPELHRYLTSADADLAHPMLVTIAELTESKHPSVLRISIHHRLQIERQVTPVATAETWLQAIRERLADTDAFIAHILTLDSAAREGWCIHRVLLPNDVVIKDDAEARLRQWELTTRLIVQIEA